MRYVKLILVVGLIGLVWLFGCGGPDWSLLDPSRPIDPRPTHYGFSLPYPVWAPPIEMNERIYDAIAVMEAARLVPIVLEIDSGGQVTDLRPVSSEDSGLARRYGPFLERCRFEPGLIGGVVSPMALLVDIETSSFNTEPIVRFPVDPNRTVNRRALYHRALAVLGVEVPTVVRFPSYNYKFDKVSRLRLYPVKLFRVDLDSLGKVQATEPVFETGPELSSQIRSAIKWGEYSPLRIDGRAVESSNFLVVSLYPMVKYPTRPIDPTATEPTPWDQARVMLLPDTVGLILPPVPSRDWSGGILDSFYQGMTPKLTTSRIVIDTAGRSRLSQTATDFFRARHALSQRSQARFFPAMKLDGSARPFEGLVYLRYLDEKSVRIWFDWLGGVDPGPAAQAPDSQ